MDTLSWYFRHACPYRLFAIWTGVFYVLLQGLYLCQTKVYRIPNADFVTNPGVDWNPVRWNLVRLLTACCLSVHCFGICLPAQYMPNEYFAPSNHSFSSCYSLLESFESIAFLRVVLNPHFGATSAMSSEQQSSQRFSWSILAIA